MVTKSKLKMALAAEKGVDFSKQSLKKAVKQAAKQKKNKTGGVIAADEEDEEKEEVKSNGVSKKNKKGKKGGKKGEEEWEDVEEEEELVDGGVSMEEDGALTADEEDEAGPVIDFAALDESDSDSSAGENDQNNSDSEADEEDEEDIPISDLEDLSDDEKEDMIPHQRLTINNTVALNAALKRFALPIHKLPFSEHQVIMSTTPTVIADVSDDLNRELAFYSQSLHAAIAGRQALKDEGVPFTRPTDYFAEMVKADEHMEKVKGKLVEEAASKKASAEARKQRDLKKFGKQVQVAKLQEREKEKKATLDKIKVLKRKRQGADATETNEADLFDVGVEEELSSAKKPRTDRAGGPNKRATKDAKYGHGGKKRFKKSGDAMSSGDLTGFSSKRMKTGGSANGAKKRPGKARRAGGKR